MSTNPVSLEKQNYRIVSRLQTSLAALQKAEEQLSQVQRRILGGNQDTPDVEDDIQGQSIAQMAQTIHETAHRIMEATERLGNSV